MTSSQSGKRKMRKRKAVDDDKKKGKAKKKKNQKKGFLITLIQKFQQPQRHVEINICLIFILP